MPKHDILWQRLESARPLELQKLGEYLALSDLANKLSDQQIDILSREIRSAAGHTAANWFRGPHDFLYSTMLVDVADKLAPGWTLLSWPSWKINLKEPGIENQLEEMIWGFWKDKFEERINKIPQAEREELRKNVSAELERLGYSQALISQIGAGLLGGVGGSLIGPALAYQIVLSSLSGFALLKFNVLTMLGFTATVAVPTALSLGLTLAVSSILFLPIFGIWLGNTAYRKTIPVTLYLIQIKKLREAEAQL
jgi:hypothetical protein